MSLSDRNPYEVHAELVQRIERLESEVERLRAALKTIESASDWHPDDMQAFARAACQT